MRNNPWFLPQKFSNPMSKQFNRFVATIFDYLMSIIDAVGVRITAFQWVHMHDRTHITLWNQLLSISHWFQEFHCTVQYITCVWKVKRWFVDASSISFLNPFSFTNRGELKLFFDSSFYLRITFASLRCYSNHPSGHDTIKWKKKLLLKDLNRLITRIVLWIPRKENKNERQTKNEKRKRKPTTIYSSVHQTIDTF